ncbi:hypothetical protein ABW21_db0205577 [Orbilia brochopaga]|nr:hypothetical protein ABW21_db0205577 [Drechslerella brochopaga]
MSGDASVWKFYDGDREGKKWFQLKTTNIADDFDRLLYAWTGSIKSDKGDSVLFEVSKWRELCGLGPTKYSWSRNRDYCIVSGRDVVGNDVRAPTKKGRATPRETDFINYFNEGQNIDSSTEASLSKRWEPVDFDWPPAQGGRARGWRAKVEEAEKLYPVDLTSLYARLRLEDIQLMSPNSSGEILYISRDAFEALTSKNNRYHFPFWNVIAVRDDLGVLHWVPVQGQDWPKYYANATRAVDYEGSWTRAIDTDIHLHIYQTGDTRLTIDELKQAFAVAKASLSDGGVTSKLTYSIETGPVASGLTLLGKSPFDDYRTYVEKAVLDDYLAARPNHTTSIDSNVLGQADKSLPQAVRYELQGLPKETASKVTAAYIRRAGGTRDEATSQRQVMGVSATKVRHPSNYFNSHRNNLSRERTKMK